MNLNKKYERLGGRSQVVECLLSKHEALSSKSSILTPPHPHPHKKTSRLVWVVDKNIKTMCRIKIIMYVHSSLTKYFFCH
jgi:hypothetical protein